LAKTLQEDPSCQLCNILQKYLLQSDVAIDTNLKDPFLPNLSILRQVSLYSYKKIEKKKIIVLFYFIGRYCFKPSVEKHFIHPVITRTQL